jgi:hypothetical protein
MSQGRFRSRLVVGTAAALLGLAVVPGTAQATLTSHTGSGRPAMANSGGRLYVSWAGSTGSPSTKELVFGWTIDNGVHITKITNPERTPQGTGPALNGDGSGMFLAWADGKAANTLTAAYYNGTAFTCRTAFSGISTAFSPALASDDTGLRYLAWTDALGQLNVGRLDSSACATTGTLSLVNRITLHDISFAGPALGWDSNVFSSNLGFMLGWVDRGGDFRVASYDGTAVLKNRSIVQSPVKVTGAPSLSALNSDDYATWRGVDGNVYFAYSEGCQPSCFQTSGSTSTQGTGGVGLVSDSTILISYFDGAGRLNIS